MKNRDSSFQEKLPSWYETQVEEIQIKEKGDFDTLENCDRLLKIASNLRSFQALGVELISYLGTIFSRYISFPTNLQISVNKTEVKAWNPYLRVLDLLKRYIQNIKITPIFFLINHTSKTMMIVAGINGWNLQQGFYVFRNKTYREWWLAWF